MKILFVATVRSHIGQFHMPFIKYLVSQGHEVHAAFKDNSADKKGLDLSAISKIFEIPFERSPYKARNLVALAALTKVIDRGDYDIIHCHTPMGAVITRLAAGKARKKGTRVFYTAHGFHFYKGASRLNWLLFYPIEKLLASQTDVLITINQEDYDLAVSRDFRAGKIVRINGVGVDLSKFSVSTEAQKRQAREDLGIAPEQFVMLYAADLSKRKNQPMLFRALAAVKDEMPDALLLLPGQPIMRAEYEQMCAELGIADRVRFLGYRRDIDKLLAASDCVVSSSRQEGLPINLIEAAARGKYILATDVRGNADVVHQSGYGTLVDLNDDAVMAEKMLRLYREGCPTQNLAKQMAVYDQQAIIEEMRKIYEI